MSLQILKSFRDELIRFCDDLIEVLQDNKYLQTDVILTRLMISEQMSIQTVMLNFIKFILPYKYKLKNRDEIFFLESKSIFGSLADKTKKTSVPMVKQMWVSGELTDDDKDVIFRYFDTFIRLAEMYITKEGYDVKFISYK